MSLRERKQQRAREQIVEAAYALFAERGFAQVTVADIAERAEVGRTTFFRYFGDKQEVVFADEQQLFDGLAALPVPDGPAAADVADALTQLWELSRGSGALFLGDLELYAERQRLIAAVPELQDRVNRKMQRIAGSLEQVLLGRGTDPEVSYLAAQIAIACFRAAQRSAGEDPVKVMPAMERVVGLVISTAPPSP